MKGKIKIDPELCKGCTYCVIACPKDVLIQDKCFNKSGHYPIVVTRPEKCTGCALCTEMCPEIAIEVWRENGPSKDATAGTPPD